MKAIVRISIHPNQGCDRTIISEFISQLYENKNFSIQFLDEITELCGDFRLIMEALNDQIEIAGRKVGCTKLTLKYDIIFYDE